MVFVMLDGSLFGCYKCILPLVAVGFFEGEVFGVGIGYSTGDASCGNVHVQKCLWQGFWAEFTLAGLAVVFHGCGFGQKWDNGDETSLWGEGAFSLVSESIFHFGAKAHFHFLLGNAFSVWNNIQGWFQFLSLKITPISS